LISYSKITNIKDIEDIVSIIPIVFIPFNNNENECYYCKSSYSITLLFEQKYCKNCFMLYIKYTAKDNLDIYISTRQIQCNRHKPRGLNFCTQNIQEWCNNCSEISHFKIIVTSNTYCNLNNMNSIINGKVCKLCGESIYQKISSNNIEFKLCVNCYKISSEWVKSTVTKKVIPILYLLWWDAQDKCTICNQILIFKSNYHKYCSNCRIIYASCRYCLTTNIIFGITDQSQCKKCKRIIFITIGITNIEESFISTKVNIYKYNQIVKYANNTDKNSNLLGVYNFINRIYHSSKQLLDWISYSKNTIISDDKDFLDLIIPIIFIPFSNNENEIYYCKISYSMTPIFEQKYCKYCLMLYSKYASNNNLDVYINTKISGCNNGHKPRGLDFCTQNIQEWCNNCSEISHFKQIVTKNRFDNVNNYNNYEKLKFIESVNFCNLCKKLIFQQQNFSSDIEFKICSKCYIISSGWVESALIKKYIPILYLPWWDTYNQCIVCNQFLEFKSDCQKWCPKCIIIYIGCRYCLTTNIIFGIIDKSQCKKCERIEVISSITFDTKDNIYTCSDINDVLYYIQNAVSLDSFNCKIANYMEIINENANLLDVYDFIRKISLNSGTTHLSINEIPYSQITDFNYIAEGGFGIIYKAVWLGQNVAVKKFSNSQNISKYFLNEVINLEYIISLLYLF
jgi:hypothetical protein